MREAQDIILERIKLRTDTTDNSINELDQESANYRLWVKSHLYLYAPPAKRKSGEMTEQPEV